MMPKQNCPFCQNRTHVFVERELRLSIRLLEAELKKVSASRDEAWNKINIMKSLMEDIIDTASTKRGPYASLAVLDLELELWAGKVRRSLPDEFGKKEDNKG